MNEYTPDNWVIVKIQEPNEQPVYKVLAGWNGGFLHGSSWQLSSGILSVEEDENNYYLLQHSGSLYICKKDKERLSPNTQAVLNRFVELVKDDRVTIVALSTIVPFKGENDD